MRAGFSQVCSILQISQVDLTKLWGLPERNSQVYDPRL